MGTYRVSFFGHRYIDNIIKLEAQLENVVKNFLKTKEYVEFLVGRNGDFDRLVSSVIRKVKNKYRSDNSSLILVLPYMTAELRDNTEYFEEYYDEIEICASSEQAHFKSAIQIRNHKMIDNSDTVVFFVERKNGGAYTSYKYALSQNKNIINLADVPPL